jgi:hypothetical protein
MSKTTVLDATTKTPNQKDFDFLRDINLAEWGRRKYRSPEEMPGSGCAREYSLKAWWCVSGSLHTLRLRCSLESAAARCVRAVGEL